MEHHQHGHQNDPSHADPTWGGMAEYLDLDADVVGSALREATDRVGELAPHASRILDLGCGTGAGTFALAVTFPNAGILAVDGSAELLAHLRANAVRLGVDERVTTVRADLDRAWPAMDPVDVTWAGMSMHHLADPARVLADAHRTTKPGGVFAAYEMDGPLRFLPDGELSAIESRGHAISEQRHAAGMPHRGADWGPILERAGFTDVEVHRIDIDLRAPLHPSAGRYAQRTLLGLRAAVDGRIPASDLAVLDAVLADDGLLHRDDLHLRGSRTLWTGRKGD